MMDEPFSWVKSEQRSCSFSLKHLMLIKLLVEECKRPVGIVVCRSRTIAPSTNQLCNGFKPEVDFPKDKCDQETIRANSAPVSACFSVKCS